MEECVICLEECDLDISNFRIDDCECKCKYLIHFECLAEYLESSENKCLYCGKHIFETRIIQNLSYQSDYEIEEHFMINYNSPNFRSYYNDINITICFILMLLLLLIIIMSIVFN